MAFDFSQCTLCPRMCRVDRTAGQTGFCGMSAEITAARAALHHWEEPPISGDRGSGAVFFSGCSLGCSFCQNTEISHGKFGKPVSTESLRSIFEALIAQGAHNINLVTATHFLPAILPALEPKLPVPVVYNCGGYERVETLQKLDGLVDIYLPDLKYAEGDLAKALSKAPDYFPVACRAIDEMFRQVGPVAYDENGMLKKGVIIRHLVLPGHVSNSLKVLDYIAEHFPKGSILVSLMAQYVPSGSVKDTPPYNRTVTEEEYDAVVSWMELLELEDGFLQEPAAATDAYLPDFSLEGIPC